MTNRLQNSVGPVPIGSFSEMRHFCRTRRGRVLNKIIDWALSGMITMPNRLQNSVGPVAIGSFGEMRHFCRTRRGRVLNKLLTGRYPV